jgi:hypothetical protein
MNVLNLKAFFLTKIYNLSFLGLGNRPERPDPIVFPVPQTGAALWQLSRKEQHWGAGYLSSRVNYLFFNQIEKFVP